MPFETFFSRRLKVKFIHVGVNKKVKMVIN